MLSEVIVKLTLKALKSVQGIEVTMKDLGENPLLFFLL